MKTLLDTEQWNCKLVQIFVARTDIVQRPSTRKEFQPHDILQEHLKKLGQNSAKILGKILKLQ